MSTVDHCNVFSRRGWRVAALKQPGSVQHSMRKTYEAKIPIIFSICWPHFTSSMLNSVRLLSLHVPVGCIAYPVFLPVFKNVFGLRCAQDWNTVFDRERQNTMINLVRWRIGVLGNQVIQINLLLLCEQHGVYINKKKNCLCAHTVCWEAGVCASQPFIASPGEGKKTKYPVSFCKSHNALFPHRYLQAHCFGFGHVTVTAMRAGKTSSMTAAVFLSWQDSAQERIYSREEKACVRSEEEMHRE